MGNDPALLVFSFSGCAKLPPDLPKYLPNRVENNRRNNTQYGNVARCRKSNYSEKGNAEKMYHREGKWLSDRPEKVSLHRIFSARAQYLFSAIRPFVAISDGDMVSTGRALSYV